VDCRRTDRSQPYFAGAPVEKGKKDLHGHSTISPDLDDFGAQSPTNEHIERLGAILLTYNFYERDLGMCLESHFSFMIVKHLLLVRLRAGYVGPLRTNLCCYGCG